MLEILLDPFPPDLLVGILIIRHHLLTSIPPRRIRFQVLQEIDFSHNDHYLFLYLFPPFPSPIFGHSAAARREEEPHFLGSGARERDLKSSAVLLAQDILILYRNFMRVAHQEPPKSTWMARSDARFKMCSIVGIAGLL